MLQLVDVLLRQQVRPSGKDLAELDIGGAELHEALPKRLRLSGRIAVGGSISSGHVGPLEIEEPLTVGELTQTIIGKESQRRSEARKMLWREDHAARGGRKHARLKWLPAT